MKELTLPLDEYTKELQAAQQAGSNRVLNQIAGELRELKDSVAPGTFNVLLETLNDKSLLKQLISAINKPTEIVKEEKNG